MGNLNNLYISQSFQSLAHLGTNTSLVPGTMTILQDGIGQSLNISFDGTNISSSGNIYGANITASVINTGSFVTTSSFNAYSQSVSSSLTNLSASLTVTDNFLQAQIDALDVSGSAVSVASLNAFTASQLIINTGYNTFTQSANIRLNNLESTTASLNSSVTQLNASSASQQVSIDALNTNSASVNTSITNINSATASLFTSASLAIVTASVNNDDITFTKGDGSQFTIQVATGSFALSASYAETSSYAQFATDIYLNVKNTTGAQLNKGTVVRIIGATGDNALIATASWEDDNNSANTLGFLYENIANDAFGKAITQGTLLGIDTDPVLGYTAGQLIYLSSSGQYTNVIPPAPYHEVRLGQVLRAQQNNGSVYILIQNGYELAELHDVDISTGSLANNDLLAYNSASGQWENKTLTQVGAATTGSNTFTGDQTLTDPSGNFITLSDASGSLMLVAKGSTSASLHLSASAAGIGNIIFKTNSNTADTIISGSSNLFVNATAPTAGFKRYVGGSGNIMLNASNVPQISGSMAFSPTMNNNYFGGNSTSLIMRGPVSSSTYTISGNSILGTVSIGSSAANHAQGLVSGVTMTGNEIPGTLTLIANKSNLSASLSFTNNILNGAATINVNSSSVTMNGNIISDLGLTLNNNFFSGSAGVSGVTISGNNFGGISNTITIQGTLPVGTNNGIFLNGNTILGGLNTIFIDPTNTTVSGTNAYHSANRNIIGGSQLIISASSFGTDNNSLGSAYFGRYNANDGIRNKTSEIVFAVGTGNSTTRKTGFLIDSGSNTFVEGTLNVSGATSLNGNLNITGSLTASLQQGFVYVGNASGITTTVSTSSFGGGADLTSLNAFTASQLTINSGYNTFTASQLTINTGYNTFTASQLTINSGYNTFTQSANTSISNLNAFTASQLTINSGYNTFTASIDSKFATLGTQTGSFATTGSNTFRGNERISGSLSVSGSVTFEANTTFITNGGNTTNIRLGDNALGNAVSNTISVAIGNGAMRYASGSTQNTAIGVDALKITSGSNNFALGAYAMELNTTGNQNVAIGVGALNKNINGTNNVVIGNDAGFFNASGSSNTLIGASAGNNINGGSNTIIGRYQGSGEVINNNIILSDGAGSIKAQYSGSAWSFQDNIKFNKGTNKTSDIVTVNATATINNSLVTADSIIIVTCQDRQNQADEYPPVVGNKTTGAFDIFTNVATNMEVAYLIINPT